LYLNTFCKITAREPGGRWYRKFLELIIIIKKKNSLVHLATYPLSILGTYFNNATLLYLSIGRFFETNAQIYTACPLSRIYLHIVLLLDSRAISQVPGNVWHRLGLRPRDRWTYSIALGGHCGAFGWWCLHI